MIKFNFPTLELLSKSQLREIHYATLEVLQKTGVVFKNNNALKIFDQAGAYVDYKKQRVYIPTHLVEEAIRKAPSRFTWYARNPKKSIRFENGRIHFAPVCTPPFVYDIETGLKRPATLKDFENIVRIMDYLKRVDEGYGVVHPQDVPEHAEHAYCILYQIKNTEKCIRGRARGSVIAKDCLKMVSMAAGSEEELMRKPMLLCMVNPTSPLQWGTTMIEGALEYVKLRQPIIPSAEVMAGATGPATLAGTMVQHNAENLAMIVFAQILNPGAPVVYGTVSTVLDMRTGVPRLGGPELGVMAIGFAQLARYYGIPSRCAAGNTDSKTLDIQAGYETAFNIVLAVLSGFNYITYALGSVDFSSAVCYEKIITDHEFLGMVEQLAKGIAISDETLAIDVIDEVGPGGNFLTQKHTRKFFRKEHFIPEIFDTQPYERWIKSNTKDIRNRAKEEIRRILKEHQSPPLDKDIEKMLENYVKMVKKRSR
ncbi:hypothetical protein DRO69_08955 [Candidatus Bathyarchaeota archaeon]|nr:MAG: hypothetical protein DRO69_08955 [Candidatus Bathyarchaeota archaeon]